jgi:hypothetical protein
MITDGTVAFPETFHAGPVTKYANETKSITEENGTGNDPISVGA